MWDDGFREKTAEDTENGWVERHKIKNKIEKDTLKINIVAMDMT